MNPIDYSLYLVTAGGTPLANVEQAIKGGVTLVQLREKDAGGNEFYASAIKHRQLTAKHGVPLIINDRVDIAMAVGADGVHVGQSDIPCAVARKIMGDNKIVGVSATTLAQAIKAEKDGADYIGVGAMFATTSKQDAAYVSIDELKRIRQHVNIPVVVIGGITHETIPMFRGMGVDGFAMISPILSNPKPMTAARKLRKQISMIEKISEPCYNN